MGSAAPAPCELPSMAGTGYLSAHEHSECHTSDIRSSYHTSSIMQDAAQGSETRALRRFQHPFACFGSQDTQCEKQCVVDNSFYLTLLGRSGQFRGCSCHRHFCSPCASSTCPRLYGIGGCSHMSNKTHIQSVIRPSEQTRQCKSGCSLQALCISSATFSNSPLAVTQGVAADVRGLFHFRQHNRRHAAMAYALLTVALAGVGTSCLLLPEAAVAVRIRTLASLAQAWFQMQPG